MSTIYEYNGKELFTDEEDAYTIDEIQAHYSQHFAELVQASYTVVPAKDDQPKKVIFAKTVGTKGLMHPVVERLTKLEAKPLECVTLLHSLVDTNKHTARVVANPDEAAELAERITAACNEANQIGQKSKEVFRRCLHLKPIAATTPPHGF